ncbi:hypothetical protein KJ980_05885 [Patescibacteria group bacterium]|nr:hypothetical protein [Patescibacteria group bacterium]MBU4015970.1 hypothetical protein [Patescibacteria group bacterium]MBU4099150.1 hypothetical protein [Patescibacteria group bacterium]
MEQPQPCKTCEESHLYEKNKKTISNDIKLLDDFLSGAIFAIAQKPEAFPILNNQTLIRSIKVNGALRLPNVIIYFKDLEEKIILCDIEIEIPS